MDKAARDALIAQKIAGTKVPVIKGNQYITKALFKVFYWIIPILNVTILLIISQN